MTEIVCILDRSGSMSSLRDEVIGSYNNFVQEQKTNLKDKDNTLTLVIFDDKYEVVYERISLDSVPQLTPEIYFTRGNTSLNDAIGKSINNVSKDKTKVLVLIQTDGLENSSMEYKSEQIKDLIKEKEKIGWQFNFIGAGPAAFEQGKQYIQVISPWNCTFTNNDTEGIREGFNFMSRAGLAYCN